MENEKIFELIETMYADLKGDINGIKGDIKNLKGGQEELKLEIRDLKKTVTKIENEHGKKLESLFDGYKQNSEQLNRIEAEVIKHEEVIIRRVK